MKEYAEITMKKEYTVEMKPKYTNQVGLTSDASIWDFTDTPRN